jgi:hypothetical protein
LAKPDKGKPQQTPNRAFLCVWCVCVSLYVKSTAAS